MYVKIFLFWTVRQYDTNTLAHTHTHTHIHTHTYTHTHTLRDTLKHLPTYTHAKNPIGSRAFYYFSLFIFNQKFALYGRIRVSNNFSLLMLTFYVTNQEKNFQTVNYDGIVKKGFKKLN